MSEQKPTEPEMMASAEASPEPGDDLPGEALHAEPAPAVEAPVFQQPPLPRSDPQPTAVHVSVDEKAYAQYKALAQAVLESAELASRSAEAALSSGQELKGAAKQLRELTDVGHKKARLLLAISAGFMLLCLIFFLIMGVRMVSRVHQLDVTVAAAAQRVADMQLALESVEKLGAGLGELSQKQSDLAKVQTAIEARIDAALKQTEAMTQKVPTETAKQVASKSDTMMRQVQSVGSGLQAQSKAVQDLSKELQSLKAGLGQVDGLKKDVEALVTLQRERYLEALQKNQAAAKNSPDRVLQYPRPSATSEPGKP
jgi:hypothetical protein